MNQWQPNNPEMMTNDAAYGSADGMAHLLRPWHRLADQLSPLIGESGFCALYGRAARLAAPAYGWLLPSPTGKSIESTLQVLAARLAAVPGAEAGQANVVLLSTFTRLLAGLIGEALTTQLLAAAGAGEHTQQNVQEQK